jgi:hypothetical protein
MWRSRFARLIIAVPLLAVAPHARGRADDGAGDGCICKSMTIRAGKTPGDKTALGPTADGKSVWRLGKDSGDDGKTLGPLAGNPANKPNAQGQSPWVGYSFEVVTKIEGNPAKCAEIQLAKASGEFRGGTRKECEKAGLEWDVTGKFCKYVKQWTGNQGNLDKAGKPKIDITTKEQCDANKGTWDGKKCSLEFPWSGKNYGPDAKTDDDPGGAYEKPNPSTLKRHVGQTIIWMDKVGFTATGDGSWLKASLLPVVRGTDGKYCFAQLEIDLRRTKTGADETLDVTQQKDGADKTQIP